MLTQAERDSLAKEIFSMAALYGHSVTLENVRQFIDILQKFSPGTYQEYMKAFTRFATDKKNQRFPIPAQIIALMGDQLSVETQAVECASRIRAAVGKFGWAQPTEAKNYIGDLGWLVVGRSGGWTYLCENLGASLSVLTYQAQARELAKSLLEQNKLGVLDQPMQLQKPEQKAGLNQGLQKFNMIDFNRQKNADNQEEK